MRTPFIVLFTAAILCLLDGCQPSYNYSDGSRVGTVVTLSRTIVPGGWNDSPRSWEGQLQMGADAIWEFSIADESPEVVAKVRKAMRSGGKMELTYRQTQNEVRRHHTSYLVTDVKTLDSKGEAVPITVLETETEAERAASREGK